MKGAIRKFQPSKGEFVSNLFLVKKDGGGGSKTSDKFEATECLYVYIPYCHFKMEGLQKRNYICKLNLKDTYFSVPLEKNLGNLFASVGQETCTNSFAFALVWDQHYKYLQNC